MNKQAQGRKAKMQDTFIDEPYDPQNPKEPKLKGRNSLPIIISRKASEGLLASKKSIQSLRPKASRLLNLKAAAPDNGIEAVPEVRTDGNAMEGSGDAMVLGYGEDGSIQLQRRVHSASTKTPDFLPDLR